MKKSRCIAVALTAIVTAACFAGCRPTKEEDGATLEIPFENSYRCENIAGAWNWQLMDTIGDNVFFVKSSAADQYCKVEIMVYNITTGESTEFEPAINAERSSASNYTRAYLFLDRGDGTTGIVCNEYSYNASVGVEEIYRRCIEIYDENWNLVGVEEIPEDFANGETLGMSWGRESTILDAEGNWYHCDLGNSVIHTYNSDYQKYGEIKLPDPEEGIGSIFNGSDGAVYVECTSWDAMSGDQIVHIYKLHAENRTAEELNLNAIPVKYELTNYFLVDGSGDYLYYYITDERLYGVTMEGAVEEVIHWNNSDFVRRSIVECEPLPDGRFLLGETTSNSGSMSGDKFWIAERRSEEEMENTKFMTLAAVDLSPRLEEAVLDYNRQDTGWRIMMVDYPDAETLKADMLDGIIADIICTENLHFENLASKGLFADWYELMDADESFDRADYLPNFFEALEYDDKLLRLTYDYTIETYFAKTEFASKKEGYTAAEYMDLLESCPEGMDAFPLLRKYQVVDWELYEMMDMFVNWKSGECAFDNPEFIRALEWAESRKAEDMAYFVTTDHLFSEDQALLRYSTIAQPIRWHIIQRAYFRDAELSYVGMPMYEGQEGNGGTFVISDSVSVNAQSKYKEAVWDFMKYLLSEDYQKGLTESMSIHIGTLDEKLELATQMSMAAEEFMDGTKVNVGAPTEEEMAVLRDYICGIGRVCTSDPTDAEERIGAIIAEEAGMYFAGDRTAEKAAETIQSRVSIYLSEQS